jgi:hypothetical protein
MSRFLLLAVLLAMTCAGPAAIPAVEFVIVGPRAVGMGGAGVAVTDDALATYWNPAGMALKNTIDIRAQAGAHGVDRLGIEDTLQDIKNINRNDTSAANQAGLQALVDRLPGSSVSANAAGGLYAKGTFGEHALGLTVSDVATGGAFFPTVDRNVTVSGGTINNSTQLATRALEARQVGFSYAMALAQRRLFFGATVKVIQGAAYSSTTGIFDTDGLSFAKNLGKAQIGTGVGVDFGALYRPIPLVTLGIVGKDLNEPSFDAPGGGPSRSPVRSGAAWP